MHVYIVENMGNQVYSTARKALESILGSDVMIADITPVIQNDQGHYVMGEEKLIELTEKNISKLIGIINKKGYITFKSSHDRAYEIVISKHHVQ